MLPILIAAAIFASTPGWHVGHGSVQACGEVPADCKEAASWASTVPYRDCGNCIPHRTLTVLPPAGIVIELNASVTRSTPSWMRRVRWPLRVRPSDVNGLEGVPARIGVVQRYVLIGRVQLSLFVYFGRVHPTASQLARANAELARCRPPRVR
jgi:hypothetical protein